MANLDAKRFNRAKEQTSVKDNAKFTEGQNLADRQNPTEANPQGAHHTEDGEQAE